jgi:hypothetical protein
VGLAANFEEGCPCLEHPAADQMPAVRSDLYRRTPCAVSHRGLSETEARHHGDPASPRRLLYPNSRTYHQSSPRRDYGTAGERCERLMDELIQNVPVRDVQCDELWSLIGKKEKKTTFENSETMSDSYCWVDVTPVSVH